jgi:hypothetical protein
MDMLFWPPTSGGFPDEWLTYFVKVPPPKEWAAKMFGGLFVWHKKMPRRVEAHMTEWISVRLKN